MDTSGYRGLFRMRIQAYLTAFVVNVKWIRCANGRDSFIVSRIFYQLDNLMNVVNITLSE